MEHIPSELAKDKQGEQISTAYLETDTAGPASFELLLISNCSYPGGDRLHFPEKSAKKVEKIENCLKFG